MLIRKRLRRDARAQLGQELMRCGLVGRGLPGIVLIFGLILISGVTGVVIAHADWLQWLSRERSLQMNYESVLLARQVLRERSRAPLRTAIGPDGNATAGDLPEAIGNRRDDAYKETEDAVAHGHPWCMRSPVRVHRPALAPRAVQGVRVVARRAVIVLQLIGGQPIGFAR